MGISNIQQNTSVNTQIELKRPAQTQYFRGNTTNTLERTPQSDEFNKGMSTGAKVGIGMGVTLALAAIADFAITRGKFTKKIFGFADDGAKDAKQYLDDLERQAKEKLETSNKNNDEWLKEQHKLKEEEYSNWWNDAIKKQEEAQLKLKKEAEEISEAEEKLKKEAQEYLEKEENALKEKIAQSNKNNDEWVETQHNIREAEYSNWWKTEMTQKLEQEIAPLKAEIQAAENEIRALYKKMRNNEPISITEAEATLKKFTDKKAELHKMSQNAPEFTQEAFQLPHFSTAENLYSRIINHKINNSIVENFGKFYNETVHEFMEQGSFDDSVVRAYKNLKQLVNNPPKDFKESDALVDKAKKLVEFIEKKTPDSFEKLKESKLFSDDILEGIRENQARFSEEQYLKMQQEINEMMTERLKEIIGSNIR